MSEELLKSICESKMLDLEELSQYLQEKGKKHNYYKIYTYSARYDSWKREQGLFLGRAKGWNDPVDSGHFSRWDSLETYHFALCMSFSQSESMAMWMLYGGMDKQGLMLNLMRSDMKEVLSASRIIIGHWKNGQFEELREIDQPGFELYCEDVLYISEEKETRDKYKREGRDVYAVKRSEEVARVFEEDLIRIKSSTQVLHKSYPWSYENECRVIAKVQRDQIEQEWESKNLSIRIPLQPDFFDRLEQKGGVIRSPVSTITDYKGSALQGKVNWDLCNNCKFKKEGNINGIDVK